MTAAKQICEPKRPNQIKHNGTQSNATRHKATQSVATDHSAAQHSAAQHSTAQHSTAQNKNAQPSPAQHSNAQKSIGVGMSKLIRRRRNAIDGASTVPPNKRGRKTEGEKKATGHVPESDGAHAVGGHAAGMPRRASKAGGLGNRIKCARPHGAYTRDESKNEQPRLFIQSTIYISQSVWYCMLQGPPAGASPLLSNTERSSAKQRTNRLTYGSQKKVNETVNGSEKIKPQRKKEPLFQIK